MATYDFSSEGDVARFDRDLNEYSSKWGLNIEKIDLVRCFQGLYKSRSDLFYVVLDLKLSIAIMYCDDVRMLKCQSRSTPEETFEFYRYLTSFIVRYRAIYDKFMSLVIRIGYPEKQKDFEQATRKNRAFCVFW